MNKHQIYTKTWFIFLTLVVFTTATIIWWSNLLFAEGYIIYAGLSSLLNLLGIHKDFTVLGIWIAIVVNLFVIFLISKGLSKLLSRKFE